MPPTQPLLLLAALCAWLGVPSEGTHHAAAPAAAPAAAANRAGRTLGPASAALFDALQCLGAAEGVVFGHQLANCGGRARPAAYPPLPGEEEGFVDCAAAVWANGSASWPGCQPAAGTLSDVRNVSGKDPGLYGFDWQWAVGVTYPQGAGGPTPVQPRRLAGYSFDPFIAHARDVGALVTIDMHFVSPLTLEPMDSTGSPITALLPGGKANAMWTSWLDGLADQLAADPDNAFVLRPFHEMTLGLNGSAPGTPVPGFGGWWWAAGAGVTPAEYRAAFNYTRWYIEEFRGTRNALWAYAPSSPTTACHPPSDDCAAISYGAPGASYYPGDENVDVVCFDRYGEDDYSSDLLADCRAAVTFAEARGKVAAICETGVRGGIQNTNLSDIFTRVLLDTITGDDVCSRVSYLLTWSEGPMFRPPNRSRSAEKPPTYWVPVQGDALAPDFAAFADSNRTRFAGELGACAAPLGMGCTHDDDCSLLGVCDTGRGRCLCDRGWTGPDCSRADLAPLDLSHGYHNRTEASWGGRALPDPAVAGRWHLYMSQFANGCALAYWQQNSFVGHAVSTTGAAGPYRFVGRVYEEFHHNPTVVGPTPDGFYLMYMIGVANASDVVDCRHNPRPFPPGSGLMGGAGTIAMGWARTPSGPWSDPKIVLRNYDRPSQNQSGWDCYVTNPSVVLHPDGEVMLVFSSVPCAGGFEEALGSAFASHWNGTYVEAPQAIWQKQGPRQSPTSSGAGNVEDPFAWRDPRGNYHIVAHSQGGRNVCGGGHDAGSTCGIHFFSTSARGPWHHSSHPVYGAVTPLSNGSNAYFRTRQRPQIVFSDDMRPRYLFHGGSFDEDNRGTTALERTFVFEFV